MRPFYVKTVRPHVWAIMLRTAPDVEDRMMATVGARGLGDDAARAKIRAACDAMNAKLLDRDPTGGRIGAAADLGIGGPIYPPTRILPMRLPGPRPFTTAAEDRIDARRAIAAAAIARTRPDRLAAHAAAIARLDAPDPIRGGRWAGD